MILAVSLTKHYFLLLFLKIQWLFLRISVIKKIGLIVFRSLLIRMSVLLKWVLGFKRIPYYLNCITDSIFTRMRPSRIKVYFSSGRGILQGYFAMAAITTT